MTMFIPFNTEILQLQNRLGRLVPVTLCSFIYRQRLCVILVASPDFPARQLTNSAEHLAYQLFQRLLHRVGPLDGNGQLTPEDVDFIQLQPGDEPEWLRWRLQWAGSSPIHLGCVPLTFASQEGFLQPILAEGEYVALATEGRPGSAELTHTRVA